MAAGIAERRGDRSKRIAILIDAIGTKELSLSLNRRE